MPRKVLAQTSFFTPEFADPSCLEPGGLPWLFRAYERELFPVWLFALWSGSKRRGRPAWPASVLMVALVLASAEGGMKRRGLVRRLKRDTAWRAACGLEIGGKTPDESTFRRFERYLRGRDPNAGTPRYLLLHEHFVRLCTEEGVVGAEASWVTDSTPMWCFGAIRDTVRLLGDGLRSLGRKWSRATGESLDELARRWELPLLLAKSTKGGLALDWRDAGARAEVVDSLAQAVLRIVKEVRNRPRRGAAPAT